MSVDKFGRHNVSSGKGERGPKGEGFAYTIEGNFDVQGKRLCNVLSAKDGSDAVCLDGLKNMLNPCVKETNGIYTFNDKTVTGIADPVNDQDAVNFRVLKRKSLSTTPDSHYDIQNKRLCNVSDAVNENDAVNLAGVKNLIKSCMKEVKGVFNFKGKVVSGIEEPKNDQDAISFKVMKRVVNQATLNLTSQSYNGRNKKITNVKAPETASDVVVLKFLNDNCIVKDLKTDTFNANSKIISHVSDPKEAQDVVTYNSMMMIVTKLSWVIYNVLQKDKKNKLNFTDWFSIVKLDPYSLKTWDDAFNLLEAKGNQIAKDGEQSKTN